MQSNSLKRNTVLRSQNRRRDPGVYPRPGSIADASYSYDGEGKRVKKVSPSETTVFVYDGSGQLVAEYSTALAQTPQVSYLTQDHLGSPRVVTDQNGVVTSRKDFTAFGEESVTPQRTQALKYQPPSVRQDYTGYQKDDESGLEFAQARYYNPTHGRFTSIDPLTASASIRNPQTFNRYSYVLNSPYKFVDPLGLISSSTGACGTDCPNGEGGLLRGGGGGGHGDDSDNFTETNQSEPKQPKKRKTPKKPKAKTPKKPPRVVAFAAKDSDTKDAENAFLNRAQKATKEVAQFSTGADILGGLMEFSKSGSIDEVIIHDHGFEGGIMGDGKDVGLYRMEYAEQIKTNTFPGAETTSTLARAVESGKIDIAPNGSLTIFGCNCSNLAQEISAKFAAVGRPDISVTGANNKVFEKNGVAAVDRMRTGISNGNRGTFITYKNGIRVATSSTRSYR